MDYNTPTIIVATGNKGKIDEIRNILAPYTKKIISMKEVGITDCPEENGSTFEENAFIKAEFLYKKLLARGYESFISMADDSGLTVNALGGKPGIFSARYGGEGLSDNERSNLLLSEMASISAQNRSAAFVCIAAAIMQDGSRFSSEGILRGMIATAPKGANGFGYDPIFIPEIVNNPTLLTIAQMTNEEKNLISHRAIAFNNLKHKIEPRIK